jgi:hypothetical protein
MSKELILLNGINILTTDAESRIGLYAIQYLGKAGAHITAIGTGNNPKKIIGFYSIYANKKIFIDKDDYCSGLYKFYIDNSNKYQFINPITPLSMGVLLRIKKDNNLMSKYLLPSIESLTISDNKELLTKHAQRLGVNCPKTFFRQSLEDIKKLPSYGLTFPCIIKFRGDEERQTNWHPEERYSIVHTAKDLISEYCRMHDIEAYPIIQEYICGPGYGYFALYDKQHQLKAQFCHKRIREYPISGGPSSCCESIYNEKMVQIGRRLLESLDWAGLAMVEFKYDDIRNKFFIIEINPRYWGSLPLAVLSGVNFPVLHALSTIDVNYKPVLKYRTGLKVRFLHKDIMALIEYIRKEKSLIKKLRLLLELFNPSLKEGSISLDDLKPTVYGLINKII